MTSMTSMHEPQPQLLQNAPTPASALPHASEAMVGPTQALVYNLKVRFFHNPVEVRHELARRGYTPQCISQLVKDCEQWPPRDQRQRERQTFQDQPNMKKGNDTSDIELTSTIEWYTIDHLDSITKCWSKYTVAWSPMPRCISSKTTRIGLYEV